MKCLSERSFNSERNKRRESNIVNGFRNKRIHRKTKSFDCESGDLKVKQEHCVTCTLKWSMVKDKQPGTKAAKVGPDQLGPPVRVGSTRIDSDRLGS